MLEELLMSDSPFLPARRFDADIERCLFKLAEDRIVLPARRAGYELQHAGFTGPPKPETVPTPHGSWRFTNHLDDPTAKEYKGAIPVPDDQLVRLCNLSKAGVRPDLTWLAHQLPEGYKEGDPLVPPPRQLREKDKRLWLALKGVFTLWATALAGAFAVAAAPALTPAALLGGDPIILGGVRHPSVPAVSWYVLAQWNWE